MGLKETLVKKVGPLPVWAWGGVGVGGIGVARYVMARREGGGAPSSDLGLGLAEGAFPVDVTGRAPGMPEGFADWFDSGLLPIPEPIDVPVPVPVPTPQPGITPTPIGGGPGPSTNCTCTHTHLHGRDHHGRDHGNQMHSHSHSHTKVSCGGRGCNHGG